jgi:hypothetical protein
MATLRWLGNNVPGTLKNPTTGKTVEVGGTLMLSDEQVKRLKRDGHMFADPGDKAAIATLPTAARDRVTREAATASKPADSPPKDKS